MFGLFPIATYSATRLQDLPDPARQLVAPVRFAQQVNARVVLDDQ